MASHLKRSPVQNCFPAVLDATLGTFTVYLRLLCLLDGVQMARIYSRVPCVMLIRLKPYNARRMNQVRLGHYQGTHPHCFNCNAFATCFELYDAIWRRESDVPTASLGICRSSNQMLKVARLYTAINHPTHSWQFHVVGQYGEMMENDDFKEKVITIWKGHNIADLFLHCHIELKIVNSKSSRMFQ